MRLLPVMFIIFAAFANAAGSSILIYSTSYKSMPNSKAAIFYLLFIGAMALSEVLFPSMRMGCQE